MHSVNILFYFVDLLDKHPNKFITLMDFVLQIMNLSFRFILSNLTVIGESRVWSIATTITCNGPDKPTKITTNSIFAGPRILALNNFWNVRIDLDGPLILVIINDRGLEAPPTPFPLGRNELIHPILIFYRTPLIAVLRHCHVVGCFQVALVVRVAFVRFV